MADETAQQIVHRMTAHHFQVPPAVVRDGAHFFDDLKGDSLDFVEMVFALETQFDVEITEEAWDSIYTVGDFVKAFEGARQCN